AGDAARQDACGHERRPGADGRPGRSIGCRARGGRARLERIGLAQRESGPEESDVQAYCSRPRSTKKERRPCLHGLEATPRKRCLEPSSVNLEFEKPRIGSKVTANAHSIAQDDSFSGAAAAPPRAA